MRLRILIVILLISMIFVTPSGGETNKTRDAKINATPWSTSIVITHNDNFSIYTGEGDGSSSTPWILYANITGDKSSSLISISDTTDHFIIKNSTLTNGTWGIVFNNVENGTIAGSVIFGNENGGVKFISSPSCVIYDNTIHTNKDIGVYLVNSNFTAIDLNHIYGHVGGGGAFGNSIGLNQHSGGGGVVINPSNNVTLTNNIIRDNAEYGVTGDHSFDTYMAENFIHDNKNGINFTNMEESEISWNWIYNNTEYGIRIEESNDIVVEGNSMTGNSLGDILVDDFSINIIIVPFISSITVTDSGTTITITDAGVTETELTTVFTDGSDFRIAYFIFSFVSITLLYRKYRIKRNS